MKNRWEVGVRGRKAGVGRGITGKPGEPSPPRTPAPGLLHSSGILALQLAWRRPPVLPLSSSAHDRRLGSEESSAEYLSLRSLSVHGLGATTRVQFSPLLRFSPFHSPSILSVSQPGRAIRLHQTPQPYGFTLRLPPHSRYYTIYEYCPVRNWLFSTLSPLSGTKSK